MLKLHFTDTESRDTFADRFKINVTDKIDDVYLLAGWHLLQFAKAEVKVIDYEIVDPVLKTPDTTSVAHEFIVKGNPITFGDYATVKQDLGNGFYLVESLDGTVLGDYVDSIEHNQHGMTLLQVSNLSNLNVSESELDPTTPEGHWARIRVSSRYRPLNSSFSLIGLDYKSKPELIIMDTGINFDHEEFNYPELEKEDFYTLPAFNNNYRDDVGHGTAVACMAVGKNLGVANYCKLVNIKVGGVSHNATLLEIGSAIDAILDRISVSPTVTRIVNISWGIARSSWLDAKVQSLINAGATVICAAGNQGISVEDISPAGLDTVITVGSVDKYDIPSGFNNISPSDENLTTGHGLSLDLFAPGEAVLVPTLNNTYGLTSGTSFSAPLVSGIGVTLSALHEGLLSYTELKQKILDTATKDALLFEDERFSENQNNLAYLIVADPLANYKDSSMTSYLGIHSETGEPIVFDLNSSVSKDTYTKVFPDDTYVFSVEFLDPNMESKYGEFFTINGETGLGTITKPTITLPEETKLEMVEFKGVLTSERVRVETNTLFFFNTNPLYKDTLQSDLTLALTNTNSISFYATWSALIK